MIIVGVADVGADNFIASLALETILYIVGTEAPNRFARNDAKQDVIVTAHVHRSGPAAAEISTAERRSGATASSATDPASLPATTSGGRLETGVR